MMNSFRNGMLGVSSLVDGQTQMTLLPEEIDDHLFATIHLVLTSLPFGCSFEQDMLFHAWY